MASREKPRREVSIMSGTQGAHNGGHPADHAGSDRDGLGHELIRGIQRARILMAMTEVATEHGLAGATVAQVVTRAGISRRTFYECFNDREDCFLAGLDDAITRLSSETVKAYRQPGSWREKIRAGLVALLSALDREPEMARLLIVESLGGGQRALERRRQVLSELIATIEEGRAQSKAKPGADPPADPPSVTAEGIVGAVLAVLYGRILGNDPRPLVELTNPLMGMIVLPYLGPAAASGELERPVPHAQPRPQRTNGDPLRELQMRLTYRTVRVLLALAANPGSSNRMLAESAGITDQGQISKLCRRLRGLGLIENPHIDPGPGESNAWTLTKRGEEVQRAIAHRTTPS
jgi:AcrR family transcriptional regulator